LCADLLNIACDLTDARAPAGTGDPVPVPVPVPTETG
jgi:hypothetical protein